VASAWLVMATITAAIWAGWALSIAFGMAGRGIFVFQVASFPNAVGRRPACGLSPWRTS